MLIKTSQMKRILLFALLAALSNQVSAQCVPSTEFTGSGIAFLPQPLETVYTCTGCGDHEVVLSLQTFADTTLSVVLAPGNPPLDVTVYADFFRLDSIAGLPTGLAYTTDAAFDTTYDEVENPFGYWVNPGDTATGFMPTSGCITISGPEAAWNAAVGGGPNSDGVYPLTVFLDARAANFSPSAIGGIVGFNTWLTDMGFLLDAFGDPNFTENGIRLEGNSLDVRASGVGIREVGNGKINDLHAQPNPFSEVTTIVFNSSVTAEYELGIYNVLGDRLRVLEFQAIEGTNRVELKRDGLASGVYFYTISGGGSTITKRLVVK